MRDEVQMWLEETYPVLDLVKSETYHVEHDDDASGIQQKVTLVVLLIQDQALNLVQVTLPTLTHPMEVALKRCFDFCL